MPSCPVEIHVSPQHTVPGGTSTRNPASSRTATAARPTSGRKSLVNESGHSTTGPLRPSPPGVRPANQSLNRRRANLGSSRSAAMPPALRISPSSPGAWVSRFTGPASSVASRAHSGSQPIE